ncbi:hypothetical protein [Embleya sp. AB8]|uniref:hypothetical protein n=1 Tax=Embleya sp. AB8 TaxID=3156304 RepID=UPI003C7354FC
MDEQYEDGPEPDGRMFRSFVDGEWIETPATIAGIRDALPEDRRDEFTKTIEDTPARDVALLMLRWATSTRPEIDEATRREHNRVEALTREAGDRVVMGEDPSVVQAELLARMREGT